MNLQIKQVGEKLKEQRKKLNIKQEELVELSVGNETFTRNLVSMVERGNAGVSDKFRKCIELNINNIITKRGLKEKVDFHQLFLTPEEQARDLLKEYMDNISKKVSHDEKIRYGEKLIECLNNQKMYRETAELCIYLGKIYGEDTYKLDKAKRLYNQAYVLRNQLLDENKNDLALQLKYINIKMKNYEEALKIGFNRECENKILTAQCLINNAMCMRALKYEPDEILEDINYIYTILEEKDRIFIKAKIMEANMYFEKKWHKRSLRVLQGINLSKVQQKEKIIIKTNLVALKNHMDIDNKEETVELWRDILHSEESVSSILGCLYILEYAITKIKDLSLEKFYTDVFEYAIDNNNSEVIEAFILKYLEEYWKSDDALLYILSGIRGGIISGEMVKKIVLFFQNEKAYSTASRILECAVK